MVGIRRGQTPFPLGKEHGSGRILFVIFESQNAYFTAFSGLSGEHRMQENFSVNDFSETFF